MIFQVFGIEQGPIYDISSVQFFFFTSLTIFSLSHTRDKTKNIFLNYFYYCLMTLSNSKKKIIQVSIENISTMNHNLQNVTVW